VAMCSTIVAMHATVGGAHARCAMSVRAPAGRASLAVDPYVLRVRVVVFVVLAAEVFLVVPRLAIHCLLSVSATVGSSSPVLAPSILLMTWLLGICLLLVAVGTLKGTTYLLPRGS
jgi:hypothetical protein